MGVDPADTVTAPREHRASPSCWTSLHLFRLHRMGQRVAVGRYGQDSDGCPCTGSYQVTPPGRTREGDATGTGRPILARTATARQSTEGQTHDKRRRLHPPSHCRRDATRAPVRFGGANPERTTCEPPSRPRRTSRKAQVNRHATTPAVTSRKSASAFGTKRSCTGRPSVRDALWRRPSCGRGRARGTFGSPEWRISPAAQHSEARRPPVLRRAASRTPARSEPASA